MWKINTNLKTIVSSYVMLRTIINNINNNNKTKEKTILKKPTTCEKPSSAGTPTL